MEVFWKIMRWSFESLAAGKYPLFDWRGQHFEAGSLQAHKAGQDLAGGFRGILVQTAGDLDYYSKWLETPRVASQYVC